MSLELLMGGVACFLGAGLIALTLSVWAPARGICSATALLGSVLVLVSGIAGLAGDSQIVSFSDLTPLGGFELRTTALGGVFLLLTGLVAGAVSVYSFGYLRHLSGTGRQLAILSLLNLTLAALTLLLAAGNALTFLLAWEVMSICTYVLVTVEYDHPGASQAAFLMMALSEVGFLAMSAGFALIGAFQPGHDFATLGSSPVSGILGSVTFLLFLFGFGAKAGLLPLQGWLPEAHPAAPSNISALLSAVVVKAGIYGLILTSLEMLSRPPLWWGYVALALGVVTALYGVLFSLLASDLKRALAFSTVENLGFMVAMIGAALVFRSLGRPLLEALALVAVILHALNHAVLKGTLFMGAGAVDLATGTRDMDVLGGLARRMRWTAPLFFIGAAGLAGVPPLNGFQSEWLGLQVLLQSHLLSDGGARIWMAASAALIALTFGLAVTTFIRIFGGVFLGAPRTRRAETAVEVPWSMRAGMGGLGGAAIILALLPPFGVGAASAAAGQVTHVNGVVDAVLPPVFRHPEQFPLLIKLGGGFLHQIVPANGLVIVPADPSFSSIAPTYIFLSILIVILPLALLVRVVARRRRREVPVWAGGIEAYRPSMQYTATAYTNPLRFIFGSVYQSRREIEADYQVAPFFARSIHYAHHVVEPVETYLYRPLARGARIASERIAFLQGGNVSLYLLYLLGVFLIVIFVR